MKRKLATALSAVLMGSMLLTNVGLTGVMADEEKPTVTLMLEISSYSPLVKAVEMAKEKFPEYNIVSKEWAIDGVKRAIKTTQAAGGDESIDIAFFSSTGIMGFAESGLVNGLNEYLEEDAEWKDSFEESMLESCSIDGEVYGIPWQAAYPVLVANKDIFDECGIEIKDDWNYDELMEVCATLQENGYYGLGVAAGNDAWLIRQSYLNGFETEEELDAFNRGEIPITDERVKEAFERVKALYDNNYCYPGEGALALTADELMVGVSNGKVAMFATTNGGVSTLAEQAELENYQVVNFPSISNYSTENLLGAPDVYIVPSNAKNMDATIEVLKYLTSEEVLTEMANVGCVVPLKDVEIDNEIYPELSKDMNRLHSEDFANLSDEIGDYISTTAMTNYYYSGDAALEELEQMRKNAVGE